MGFEDACGVDADNLRESILRGEFDLTVMRLKDKKATGVAGIPSEILNYLRDEVLDEIFILIQEMYETAHFPTDLKK